jgi:hypothetical protein
VPPAGLTSFYWGVQTSRKSAAFAVVAGVASAVLVAAAVGVVAHRRFRSAKAYQLLMDPASAEGYTVPR